MMNANHVKLIPNLSFTTDYLQYIPNGSFTGDQGQRKRTNKAIISTCSNIYVHNTSSQPAIENLCWGFPTPPFDPSPTSTCEYHLTFHFKTPIEIKFWAGAQRAFFRDNSNTFVCSGSVVVTAYDSESGRPGSNPEWGLIYYEASITAQGLPEPSSLRGSTLGTRAAEHKGCNWGMQIDWWLQPCAVFGHSFSGISWHMPQKWSQFNCMTLSKGSAKR